MERPDARHLSIDTQTYLRRQAIRLRQQEYRVGEISEYLGVHRNTVSEWWWEYQHYGEAALEQKARGRKVGEGRTLSASEEATIQSALQGHFPEDYEIDSALWTRSSVQRLIEQLCGVKLPVRTVGEYLRRWGYSVKKPLVRAYEQDPKAVEQWLKQDYPKIKQRAQQAQAEIEWGDESGLSVNETGGRGYAPIGKSPEILPMQGQRKRVNYIASVSNQGRVQFMHYCGSFDATVLIKFLKRLITKHKGQVFWMVDRHPVHLKHSVQQWLEAHRSQIEVFYLPSYSPELNPVEYLNGDVKQEVHARPPTRNLEQLKRRVLSQLQKLQRLPARIRSYFQHPSIAYAAA